MVVYFGFALGFFNTYLFTRQGGFTQEQYGLTSTFIAFASIMFSIASFGAQGFISKFYPYYKAHLPTEKNDQLSWALLLPCIGFAFVALIAVASKDVLVDSIFSNSPELPEYFYWILPFGFGYTMFVILEAYAWMTRRSVLSNLLKEVLFRFFTTCLVLLTTYGIIGSFDGFIRLYAFIYPVLALVLLLVFLKNRDFVFQFSISRVTKRFYSKIMALASFVWTGGLVFNLAGVFDTIVIAAVLPNGMAAVAPFTLAQYISSLIQAPQRAIISASVSPLSHAWKDKDYRKINMIYNRSSINQLVFATGMFCLIWLNFEDGIVSFNLQEGYRAAMWPFLFLGLTRIIDMGTGVNAQIIGTSTFWRFDFISGMVLLACTLPLNYFLAREMGIVGPAISNLISFTLYNLIRYLFLYRRFNMQPFTIKTVYTLLLAAASYLLTYSIFNEFRGIEWILLRSVVFCSLFISGTVALRLSPDVQPVFTSLLKRLGLQR